MRDKAEAEAARLGREIKKTDKEMERLHAALLHKRAWRERMTAAQERYRAIANQ
jgi:hypothetical protein